jgi:hypothetical protein
MVAMRAATRAPRVAGVAGGVGTSVIATALRAFDDELYDPGADVDVLVCRTTLTSMGAAHRCVAETPAPPVLVVVADINAPLPRPVRARIRMVAPHVHELVAVPYVGHWRHTADPYAEAAAVLSPEGQVPRSLEDFAKAMHRLVAAVAPLLTAQQPPREEPHEPEPVLLSSVSATSLSRLPAVPDSSIPPLPPEPTPRRRPRPFAH